MGDNKMRMNNGRTTNKMSAKRSRREHLRTAKVHLICRSEPQEDGSTVRLTPYFAETDSGWDQLISEGYDHDRSPLGPVYWRVVKRDEETLYLSTFLVTSDQVLKLWGPDGLHHCDPVTTTAVARVETNVSRAPQHRLQVRKVGAKQ